jgi:hypothetical protein
VQSGSCVSDFQRDKLLYFCRAEKRDDGGNKFNRNMGNNISQYKPILVYLTRLSAAQATSSTVGGRSMNELEGTEKEADVACSNTSWYSQ